MRWLDHFRSSRKNTAAVAKERLQIVVAHERRRRNAPDFLPRLQRDLIEVIRRYFSVDQDQVRINLEREGDYEVLELNVSLPERPTQEEAQSASGP